MAPWPSVYASHTKVRIGSAPCKAHASSVSQPPVASITTNCTFSG
ncbi:hypothetical protein BURMUCF1_1151 [Burkholderia multivorans ATCC BAA-247]|nr:hypothetical protein BURMUCF1_1151 [Burkholderia multivorans ATCC BAA-247]